MRSSCLLPTLLALFACAPARYLDVPEQTLAEVSYTHTDSSGDEHGFRLKTLYQGERTELCVQLGLSSLPPSTLVEDLGRGRLFLVVGQIGHAGWITPKNAELTVGDIDLLVEGQQLELERRGARQVVDLVGGQRSALGPHPIVWRDEAWGLYWIEFDGTGLQTPLFAR